MPLLLPRQSGLEEVLVTHASQAAMLAQLIAVNGIDDDAAALAPW